MARRVLNDQQRFLVFCQLQLETGDYDAHLPFLLALSEYLELSMEERIWLGLLYMAYYTEGSSYAAFRHRPVRIKAELPPLHYPITTQRRNLYGGRLKDHLISLLSNQPFLPWLQRASNWSELYTLLRSVYGNGRWASYTTGELMVHLVELPYTPSSFEVIDSSGPRQGLQALGLEPSEANAALVHSILAANGMETTLSQMESLLCDWAGMCKGTFYAGRNIDRQQGRILQAQQVIGTNLPLLWKIRRSVFPEWSLGELHGWYGIDKKRLKVYRDTGVVLEPDERRNHGL